jgi:diguanylate cyclase (GGDEF)-like protein
VSASVFGSSGQEPRGSANDSREGFDVKTRLQRWLAAPGIGRDVLGEYRDHIMLPMATCASAMLLPFLVYDLVIGKHFLALVILVVVLPMALDAFALWRGRRPPVGYGWLLVPVAIVFCYFVLPGWQATVGAAALVAIASWQVQQILGMPTMLRFAASAAMSIVFLNIILGVVGQLQRKLYEQATTDPLTGALNRRQLATSLSDAIEHARRGPHGVCLLVFDLDHFKLVNDRHGHAVGDQVLQRIVALVHERARRTDRLFRLGGEEFALLLPRTRAGDALRVAEQLRGRIEQADWPSQATVTISIGVAELRPAQTQEAWLKAADDALYRAKAAGRNRVCDAAPSIGRGEAPRAAGCEALVADIADVADVTE